MKRQILPVVTALSICVAAGQAADPAAAPAAVPAPPANEAPAEKPGPKTPPPKIDIQVKKGKDRSKASSESTLETFEFEVEVKAITPGAKLEGAEVELYVLGVSNANENLFNVIHARRERFDLANKAHALTTPLLQVKYSKSGGGMKLGGYLVVVSDADGAPLSAKASRASFERDMEKIRTAPVSTSTQKSFRL